MSKYYKVDSVVCSRGKTFDAEVAFKIEVFTDGESKLETDQRLIRAGFLTRELAKACAEEHSERLERIIESAATGFLAQFKQAKP